jgi:hypothetical protein
MSTTIVPAAIDFAVRDRRGYWLRPDDEWGGHADALRFDHLLDAWEAAARHAVNVHDMDAPRPHPWSVTEGYRAVVEPCAPCGGTGRREETNPYYLKQRWTEAACMSCWGYGTQAVIGLSTVQLHWGGLFDGKPHDREIHLVRNSFNGCPGPLLCGIDFRGKDGPGYSVGGGSSGPGWPNTPCEKCAAVAAAEFTGLPVFGSVGGQEMAALVGVPNRSTWDYRRPWREESLRIRRNINAARLEAVRAAV